MTGLTRALRYPWRAKGWFWQMLPLACWQLVPVIGQIMLIGYGLAVVRAAYRQQSGLPNLQRKQSFIDGLRLVTVGFVYCFPVILMVLLTFSTGSNADTQSTGGIPPMALTAVMFVYLRISGEIIKRQPALKPTLSIINKIITAAFVAFVLVRLYGLFTTLREGLQFSSMQINGSDRAMLLLATLLFAVIVVVLLVSGALFAVAGYSLLKPTTALQLMIANRGLSIRLVVATWVLIVGTLAATVAGTLFLLVPGLYLMVAGNASIWFLTTHYVIQTGAVNKSEIGQI
ncbi:MAG: DUF4013 domain-containing protein [Cyanobacteria bacterium P01_A01_bin.116]